MSDEMTCDFLYLSACCVIIYKLKHKRQKRRWWQRTFLKYREDKGAYNMLIAELTLEDGSCFKNYVRMGPDDFEYLLQKVAPHILRKDTNCRKSIPPADQLAVTLRFLATGESFTSLMYSHRISKSSLSYMIKRVCEALVTELSDEIKLPSCPAEWLKISSGFNEKWNFPHCLGAMDGKHVKLIAPPNSGTEFYNYKDTFSIVLFGIVDADYKFIYANVGVQGRISDGGIFKNTSIYEKLLQKSLNIPQPVPLPGRAKPTPYVFIADDAFELSDNICKPFPGYYAKNSWQRIFNYRICRARRIVENVFGILTAVFRVLRTTMHLTPDKATTVTLATIYLHNYLRNKKSAKYTPPGTFDSEDKYGNEVPGSWRQYNEATLQSLPGVRGRRSTQSTVDSREEFGNYFCSIEGAVPWQWNK